MRNNQQQQQRFMNRVTGVVLFLSLLGVWLTVIH